MDTANRALAHYCDSDSTGLLYILPLIGLYFAGGLVFTVKTGQLVLHLQIFFGLMNNAKKNVGTLVLLQ